MIAEAEAVRFMLGHVSLGIACKDVSIYKEIQWSAIRVLWHRAKAVRTHCLFWHAHECLEH